MLYGTNSDPANHRVRAAARLALGANTVIPDLELDRILNLPIYSNNRKKGATGSMSTFISHGQGRAHANITEFIVSALKLDSFATADSRKLE